MSLGKISLKKTILILLLIATICMSGCSASVIKDSTGTGSCQLNVAFVDAPQEFFELNENVLQNFFIIVRMKNIVTDKEYVFLLNKDNNYAISAGVVPGTYQLKGVSSSITRYTGAILSADTGVFTLEKSGLANVGIRISNYDEFISIQNNLAEGSGIVKAGMFSRKVMLDGTIYNISDLASVLDIDGLMVGPYSSKKFTDEERGVTITVVNETSDNISYAQCRVTGVEINGINAVLPGGISIGMDASEICGIDGIYGVPDKFSGCVVFNEYLWETDGIYVDPQSGDRITLSMSPYGGYVCSMKYEFECFE